MAISCPSSFLILLPQVSLGYSLLGYHVLWQGYVFEPLPIVNTSDF